LLEIELDWNVNKYWWGGAGDFFGREFMEIFFTS